MRTARVGVLLAIVAAVPLIGTESALAAGPCDVIQQRGNAITQEQLAWTKQAYSDGQITPEEAAQAEEYSRAIQKVTADLTECITTGIVPPGYGSTTPPPDTTRPVSNTFEVEIAKWRIGDHGFGISWHTSEPTRIRITVVRLSGKARASAIHKKVVGVLKAPLGATSIQFKGKVGGHKLKPGSYLLTLVATDAAGNRSKPKTRHLKILPRRHR